MHCSKVFRIHFFIHVSPLLDGYRNSDLDLKRLGQGPTSLVLQRDCIIFFSNLLAFAVTASPYLE